MSTLRQPRWLGFAVLTILVCVLFLLLGRWQWHRHEDRRERNAQYEAVASEPAVPVSQVLSRQTPLPETDQYRLVTLTGTYDGENQLLQRNPNGRSGFAVITPLITQDGQALLVNRGLVRPSSTDTNTPAADVSPPTGQVTATVRLRQSAAADDRTAPEGQVYAIDTSEISAQLPYPLYDAYGELVEQDPAPPEVLELPESNAPGLGPHLFYAVQWWLFIGVAGVGFVVLVRRESVEQSPRSDAVTNSKSS